MTVWPRLRSWSSTIFRRSRSETEMDAELRFHIEAYAEDLVRAGIPRHEALRRARIEFGGIERAKEECREARGINFFDSLLQDLRFALRMLRKSPGFTAVAVLTLALGIGVNTSIFSLVYSLALRPLPVRDPANIVGIFEEFRGHYSRGVYGMPNLLSYPEYLNYRDGNHTFAGLTAYAVDSFSLSGATEQAIAGLLASCNYFEVLGGDMARGRGFLPEDCRTPGAGSVAVISNGFWKDHFGSDPAVLGKTLTLNRQPFTVVGVTASNFVGTETQVPEVWLPLAVAPQMLPNEFDNRNWLALDNVSWLNVVGRLKPGISHRRAEAELAVLAHQMDASYPGRQTTVSVNSGAYWNSPVARSVGSLIATAILALAGFLLVIACMNMMNLLLARATTRRREIGTRLALGASRWRLVRQLLVETLLLALLGGAASMILVRWLPPLLVSAIPEMPLSPHVDLAPNFAIFAYAFLISLAATVICGLAPALQSTKLGLLWVPREEGPLLSPGQERSRLRHSSIVVQIAGCTALLFAAGVLVRGLHRVQSTSPGFITENVILLSMDLANQGYDQTRAAAFDRTLHDRLMAIPGVAGVARSAVVPCIINYTTGVTIPGSAVNSNSQPVWGNTVSYDYFQTMGIPLLRGRTFTEREAQTTGAVPAVISVAMARRFWGEMDPLGKEFVASNTVFQILGIVPDVQNVHLGQMDGPFFYGANAPDSALDAKIFVRTKGNSSAMEALIPQLGRDLDKNVMFKTEMLEQALEKTLAPSRTLTSLIAVSGILAAALAVVGIWGIVAYAASRRTHEIGIRKALGAPSRDILTSLLRQAAKLLAIGLTIGLALGAVASQLLSGAGLLFGLNVLDPATYLTIAVAFVSVTALACFLPARRAMRVDPVVALRHE